MTNTNGSTPGSQSLILKTDTRGRVFTPAHRRETLLDEFERSGLSGTQFAELSGIKYQTFAGWVFSRKRKRGLPEPARKVQSKQQQVSWLETVVKEAEGAGALPCSSLMLHLPGGVRAEIAQPHQIPLAAALVRALQKPC
jgi:hypothetical protein